MFLNIVFLLQIFGIFNHLSLKPIFYYFDDLGTENNLKFYGNECNIMAEILLSRYDLFLSGKLIAHLTTNLSASEIEVAYGNRIHSRMREFSNLIAFNRESKDKRNNKINIKSSQKVNFLCYLCV